MIEILSIKHRRRFLWVILDMVYEDLTLIDLASVALRKLGISRKEIIDTEKDCYPTTRQWAEKIYAQCPVTQGLTWISRQDDSAQAVMLFSNRMTPQSLAQIGESLSLINDGATYDDVLDLAEMKGQRNTGV
ncbi:RES domain-containing protein [Pluralibacter gergoviae]|uniref:RES domain-containing protein n=1 Tax=Pluralibacter gergoviae TaxID=61647 RepID=UPI003EDFBF45